MGPAVAVLAYLALAWPHLDRRGATAEEVQPYLPRYPVVLEWREGAVQAMPPHEPGAPPGPRWVATSQWPVVAYDGTGRLWPVLIRGYQSALGSYLGIVLGPSLGGGILGTRRSAVILGLAILLLAWLAGRRMGLGQAGAAVAALLLATSPGFLFASRSAFEFEAASRLGLLAAVILAARPGEVGWRRAAAIGAAAGLAIVARATVAATLIPALAALLLARRAPLRFGEGAAVGLLAAGLPLALLAAVVAGPGLRAEAAPLAGFPVGDLLARTAGLGRQILLQLAWLGDANSVLEPIFSGGPAIPGARLVWAAALGAVPVVLAAARLARGSAGPAERLLLLAVPGTALFGAWLYAGPNEFQLSIAVEPLWAAACGALLTAAAARPRRAAVAAAALLALRASAALSFLGLEARPANPMLSRAVQVGVVERLAALGEPGDGLVTTTYNQAGVLEAWSGGRLLPVHAWPLLLGAGGPSAERLDASWRAILDRRHPRRVLLLAGGNLFETVGTDAGAIRASLERCAAERGLRLVPEADLRTESGAPGWSIVRLDVRP